MARTIHGSFSEIKTHHVYEFSQRSSGHVAVNKFALKWQGLLIVKNSNVFEVMNRISPTHLWYSQGASTWRYELTEISDLNTVQYIHK